MLSGDVGVDTEAAGARAGVVFLADVGEVNVADLVLMIERHQQPSVPDGDITRHVRTTFLAKRRRLRVRGRRECAKSDSMAAQAPPPFHRRFFHNPSAERCGK
jgi:hypothetical protein